MRKSNMKKIITLIVVVATLFINVVGCAKSTDTDEGTTTADVTTAEDGTAVVADEASSDTIQVGIVLPTKDEPRWIQDQTRFSTILDEAGFTYQILFSQGSSATEKTNVETLITKGITVLIICPQDTSAVASTVQLAKDAGVTVIGYDRLITGTDALDYNVGFNSESVGVAQGQYLIDNATGTGNPLYLYAGALSDENAFVFFKGAWSVLQPKIADGTFVIKNSEEAIKVQDTLDLTREEMASILGQITTDWDFNVAKSKAEAHLTTASAEDKGDVYVLAPNDGTARVIADVFAIDQDITSYVITGQDAEKASIQYIIDGIQSMTVLKDTRMLTDAAVTMAKQIINGEEVVVNSEYDNGAKLVPMYQLPVLSVTKDSVKEYIFDSGYYEASEFTGL
ncbi:MAG: sugar ABC transporter substrate-binding protein [Vallitaleaceae bacterium]|jgi:putative multiple sugar transport system substrate-binding protein|nr:sugar ABC transporter substrate-binding protein [Vallitaleaceae bacterium]